MPDCRRLVFYSPLPFLLSFHSFTSTIVLVNLNDALSYDSFIIRRPHVDHTFLMRFPGLPELELETSPFALGETIQQRRTTRGLSQSTRKWREHANSMCIRLSEP